MIVCALQGQPPAAWLVDLPDPGPGTWARPLLGTVTKVNGAGHRDVPPAAGDVLRVLAEVRRIALVATDFEAAIAEACSAGKKAAALYGALVGTFMGLRLGFEGLPAARIARLAGADLVAATADRFLERGPAPRVPA
jgi:hypothetical protein